MNTDDNEKKITQDEILSNSSPADKDVPIPEEKELMNPWNNPYVGEDEECLKNPHTNERETKEHKNQRLERKGEEEEEEIEGRKRKQKQNNNSKNTTVQKKMGGKKKVEHFIKVTKSVEYYAFWEFERFQKKHQDYLLLPIKYRQILSSKPNYFACVRKAILCNQHFLTQVIQRSNHYLSFDNQRMPMFYRVSRAERSSESNMDK
ncbi:hypothetical protein RFI_21145, partial [Reticulomyxa filosa]